HDQSDQTCGGGPAQASAEFDFHTGIMNRNPSSGRAMQTTGDSPPPSDDFLARAKDVLRFTLEYAGEKKLTRAASSLTFTTVLAIVPLLAVVLALFTAFPLFSEFRIALEDFLSESLLPPSFSDTIMGYLNQFAAQASGLTAVGGIFLMVTSIMLIMTIDEAFNEIWRVE